MDKVFDLPNVRLAPSLVESRSPTKYRYCFPADHADFGVVMWELATKNPQWDFEVERVTTMRGNDDQLIACPNKVTLSASGEVLGLIGTEIAGGGERKIFIVNHRVAAERVRNNGKARTSSATRAISLVNKYFKRKSHHELVLEATQKASALVCGMAGSRKRDLMAKAGQIQNLSYRAFMGPMQEQVLALLSTTTEGKDLAVNLESYTSLHSTYEGLVQLDTKINSHQAVIIVVVQDGYVMRYNDTVSSYTSDQLPEDLRAPLGMLKLVDSGTVIDNVGCRVDNNVYAIVYNKKLEKEIEHAGQ